MTRTFYSPADRKIVVAPGASLFARFHEEAHRDQHESMTVVYRAWALTWWIRGIGWLATLWIEWDANRRARKAMEYHGLWNERAEREARANLLSYLILEEHECRPGLPQS